MPNGESGSQWLTCRVQYLDDTDPFSSSNFPEPSRPPSYTFNVGLPLCEQLAGVHRLLKAPHKVSYVFSMFACYKFDNVLDESQLWR